MAMRWVALMCAISCGWGAAHAAAPSAPPAGLELTKRWLAQLSRYGTVRLESYLGTTFYDFVRGSHRRRFQCPQDLWIVSAQMEGGPGVTCRFAGREPATCVAGAALDDEQALAASCPERGASAAAPASPASVPEPPWLPDLRRLVADDVVGGIEPFDDGPAIRIELDSDDAYFAVKTASGWTLSPVPFRECYTADRGPWRLLEGGAAMAVSASCYSGGSGSGTLTTSLRVLARADLSTLEERPIGHFRWSGGPKSRRAAGDMWARPHVEVLLEPTFLPDDRIQLRLARRSLGRLNHICSARERRLGRAVDDGDEVSTCPLPALFDLQKAVGTWQPARPR